MFGKEGRSSVKTEGGTVPEKKGEMRATCRRCARDDSVKFQQACLCRCLGLCLHLRLLKEADLFRKGSANFNQKHIVFKLP